MTTPETTGETTSTTTETAPETAPVKETSALSSLMLEWAEKLKDGKAVKDKWLDLLVNRELDERVALLDTALKKRTEQEKEIRKLNKPDQKLRDAKGVVLFEGFTEPKLKELTDAQDKLKKLDAALDLALSKNDFSKLKESK